MTRASTLLLALLVLNILLGVLCLVVARGERRSAALRLWGWGLLVYSAGILITLPSPIPVAMAKIIGNGMIAYAPILSVSGLLMHTPTRLDVRWTHVGFAASVLPIVINHLRPNFVVLVDLLSPAPIANVLFVIGAVALVRRPLAEARSAARFLAAILGFSVVVWSLRLLFIWSTIRGTNDRERADLTIALFAIAQMVIAVAATLGLLWVEVRKMEAALRKLADCDALTGLPNRRATTERFAGELARAERHGREFALLLLDVDHFKRVNDTLGHLAGDKVLRDVAAILESSRRAVDVVGRIGGEEFVVILTEEGSDGAVTAADRLRQTIALNLSVTVSGGLAVYPSDGLDWDRLFATADQRLYAAKEGGRNRIEGPPRHYAAGHFRMPSMVPRETA
jgi:diguanylate cyclase (GGDEF)-like protein